MSAANNAATAGIGDGRKASLDGTEGRREDRGSAVEEQPLVSRDSLEERYQVRGGDYAVVEDSEGDADSIDLDDDYNGEGDGIIPRVGKPGLWVWMLSCTSGISGLLFGFDTAIISAALLSLSNPPANSSVPPLSTSEKSLVTSITSITALVASLASGPLCDGIGRRKTIFLAAFVFSIGAVWMSIAQSVASLVYGRAVVGLGIGSGSAVVPMFIAEISPAHLRSRLITAQVIFITFGQVIAYLVGLAFEHAAYGWRYMFAAGAVPAIVQIVLLFWLPESPRYLVMKGHKAQAGRVLEGIYGLEKDDTISARKFIEGILRKVDRGVAQEAHGGDSSLSGKLRELWKKRGNRKALYISGGLQALQQITGFNALMYFSATIFSMLGFKNPVMTSLTVAVTNFLFTLVSLVMIPIVGKRRLLLSSIPVMAIGLIGTAIGFYFLPSSSSRASSAPPEPSVFPYVILASTTIYVAAYASGLGNVPWQQSELFPLPVRSVGTAIATSCNWSSNFLVGETFLGLVETLGPVPTFLGFASICLLGWYAIWRGYPETDNVDLEEVEEILDR